MLNDWLGEVRSGVGDIWGEGVVIGLREEEEEEVRLYRDRKGGAIGG